MGRRVVVTGMGLLTALGNDLATTWQALLDGRSGVRRITRFDPAGFATQIAAEVKDFEAERWIEKQRALWQTRLDQLDAFLREEEPT